MIDDPPADPTDIFTRVLGEARRRDEHAFGRALPFHASSESLEVWAPHRTIRCPPLGLYVDGIQTELVLIDDSVDPIVARSSNVPCRIRRSGSSVSHCYEKLQHKLLEERGAARKNVVKEIGLDRSSQREVCRIEQLFGILLRDLRRDRRSALRTALAERFEFRELAEELHVNAVHVSIQNRGSPR